MDAKEFIKEHQRMCSFYQERGKCNECPAYDPDKTCIMFRNSDMGVVDLVEEWAKNHHALSNDEMMRETFGEIKIVMAGSVTIKTPDGKVKDFRSWLDDKYVSPPIIEKGCWNCRHQPISTTSYPCSKCTCKGYEADTKSSESKSCFNCGRGPYMNKSWIASVCQNCRDYSNWIASKPEYWEAKDENSK